MPARQNMKFFQFISFIEPFYLTEYESRPLIFYPCCFFIMRIDCNGVKQRCGSGSVIICTDPDPCIIQAKKNLEKP
jgi:hypothetical protein